MTEYQIVTALAEQHRKEERSARINFALTPKNHAFVKTMSRVSARSMAEFINTIIEQYRENNDEKYKRGYWTICSKRNFYNADKKEVEALRTITGKAYCTVIGYECSNCRKVVLIDESIGEYSYCPHCGAIMHKERLK